MSGTRAGKRDESDRVRIFDTTLRDGEQAPGAGLTAAEKLEVARQLARLKVDVIEAGFPAASPGDFEAVQRIARETKGGIAVAALAYCAVGFSWQGYAGDAGKGFVLGGRSWNWIASARFFLRDMQFDGSAATLAALFGTFAVGQW